MQNEDVNLKYSHLELYNLSIMLKKIHNIDHLYKLL